MRNYQIKVTSTPYFTIGQINKQNNWGVFCGSSCVLKGDRRFTLTKRQASAIAVMLNDDTSYDDIFANMNQKEIDKYIEDVIPGRR